MDVIVYNSMLLSIVIPTFNRQKSLIVLLAKLSNSIVSSGLERDIEIIVVDDFSSPRAILPKMAIPIAHHINRINFGAPISRKKGFETSKGKFIHFHDSDDIISEKWLDSIHAFLVNRPDIDIVVTGRVDIDDNNEITKFQSYFHKKCIDDRKIAKRLIYRNCLGPLGGVTFSRNILEKIEFKRFASCQDWQMYIDAIKHSKVLVSRPDIKFIFNKTGDDRISHNPRKKILGHLQLAKITSKQSVFDNNIRLFYLYTCKKHIYNKGGAILRFYKKNRIKIFVIFLMISLYWRLT